MDNKEKNILLITLYRIFSRLYFYLPIIFPLFYIHGQTDLEIEILLAVYGLSIVFLSNVVKFLTDRFGHKFTLILGEIFKILGLLSLIFYSGDFTVSLFSQVLMGMGYTLIVGNDTIILQQTFKQINSEEYQNIQAKTNSYMFIALFVSGITGVLIFQYDIDLVLVLSIVAACFSIISISFIKYIQPLKNNNKAARANKHSNVEAETYYYVTRGLIFPTFVGIFPYLFFILMRFNILSFAIIIGLFTLSGFIASKYLTKYFKKYDFIFLTGGTLLLILGSLALLLFENVYLTFVSALILGLTSGCVRPITVSKIDNKKYSLEETLKHAEFNYGVFSSFVLLSAGILLKYINFKTYIFILIALSAIYVYAKLYYQRKGENS